VSESLVYLDHAATTPMRPEAVTAMVAEMGRVGNASSLHASGRRARRIVEESRESIAAALGAQPRDVIFTSGGTESDNLAIKGLYRARVSEDSRRLRILCAPVEHHAVLDPVEWLAKTQDAEVVWLRVDHLGRVDLESLGAELALDPESIALATVMWANNEVGTVQPIAAIAELCAAAGVPLHVDGVQAVGQLPVDAALVDSLALSGHKLGGPHGVGALVLRQGINLVPLQHGGGQERDIRSGTLDTPAIASLAAAITAAVGDRDSRGAQTRALRDDLVRRVLGSIPGVSRNGDPINSLPGIANLSFEGCEGDALLLLLDAAGIECSRGSACTAGVPQPSHVLLAMGLDPLTARGSLRFSLGYTSTQADIDCLVEVLPSIVKRARRAGSAR
jgi:cysteine desulfurase